MRSARLWARLLGVERTVVEEVDFDEERGALVIAVRPAFRERGRCGVCRRRCPGYDEGEGRRRWRALDLGTTLCYLEAEAPRVRCRRHGVVVAAVPWARHDARFTRGFDDQVAWLACQCSKRAVSELMRVSWRTVGRIVTRVAAEARARFDPLAYLKRIGIDELSHRKGQRYLTVVVDHDSGLLVWAAPGRDKKTLRRFFDLLGEERSKRIELVSADGAAWIEEVVRERCPNAALCLDPFHVVQWASAALDEVRRGLERRPPRRPERGGALAQGRPLCALAQPRGPERAPAGDAGPDRGDERAALPRLPAEGAAAPGAQAARRGGARAARGVACLGSALPARPVRPARPADRRPPARDRCRAQLRALERAHRIGEHAHPPDRPPRLRLPLPRSADRARPPLARRPLPAAAGPHRLNATQPPPSGRPVTPAR